MTTKKSVQHETTISKLLSDGYADIISRKKGGEIFNKWEKSHLRDLTQTTKSYKIGSPVVSKIKTLIRLSEKSQIDLIEKWRDEIELSGPFAELSDSDIVNLTVGQLIAGKKPSETQIKAGYFLRLLHPEVSGALKSDMNSYTESQEQIQNEKITEIEPEPSQQEISAIVIANWIVDHLDGRQKPDTSFTELAPFFKTLQKINPFAWDKLCEISLDHDSINEAVSIVSEATGDQIPDGRDEYFAVLSKPFDLPGTGFAAHVVAVQGAGNALIPVTRDHAQQLFPHKGSAFISPRILAGLPESCKYFPAKLIRSTSGGQNDYKVEKQWNDIAEVISTEYGVHQIDALHDELKSLSFKNTAHPIWFRLPDGALISPKTRRDQLIATTFKENWRYLPQSHVPQELANKDYIRLSLLSNFQPISLASEKEFFAEWERMNQEELLITDSVSNRLYYLDQSHNDLEKKSAKDRSFASEYAEQLLFNFQSMKFMEEILEKEIAKKIAERAPEIDDKTNELKALQEKIHKLKEQAENRKKQTSSIENDLKTRVEKAIKRSAVDLASVLDDPLVNSLLRNDVSTGGHNTLVQKEHPTTLSSNLKLPILNLSRKVEKRSLFKKLGIKIHSEADIEGLYAELVEFTRRGQVPFISGPGSFFFASQVLANDEHSDCQVVQLRFAEYIAEAQRALISNTGRNTLILPTEDVDHRILNNELTFRAELENPGNTMSIIVQAKLEKALDSVVIPFLTPALNKVDANKTDTADDIFDFYENIDIELTKLKESIIGQMPELLRSWHLQSLKLDV